MDVTDVASNNYCSTYRFPKTDIQVTTFPSSCAIYQNSNRDKVMSITASNFILP